MNGCIYRTKDGECDLWTDGKHKSFCDPDCTDKHPSNADLIRAMTDEELAKFINGIGTDVDYCGYRCRANKDGCGYSESTCTEAWLEWLKSPEKDCDSNG